MSRTLFGSLARASAIAGLCLGLAIAPMSAANAAPAAPSGLASSSEFLPALSWDHSPGATSYVVELSRTRDSSGLIGSYPTVNRQFVPTTPLPTPTSGTDLFWRVAAKDSAVGDYSAWTELPRGATYAPPTVTSPVTGHVFVQPANPATLAWNPVTGTQEYEIQVSTDQEFTDPVKIETFKTISTTLIVPKPQVKTEFWFQVRARLSTSSTGPTAVFTEYSTPRSYEVSALPAAVRTDPATDNTAVEDAILNWDPIMGAKTYDIQIATDPAFGSIVHDRSNITGTSYARPNTLDNDFYYWRVRAKDVAGNVPAWDSRPTWRFERHWPNLPMPLYPANPADLDPANPNDSDQGVVVGDPFYFEWQPVELASSYRLELSTDSTFSTIVGTCATVNTTFTPAAQNKCMPGAEKTYWWRVTALDQHRSSSQVPVTSQNVFNDARFTYSPQKATPLLPVSGETVQVPTMSWSPVAGASSYKVTLMTGAGSVVTTQTTSATSFTPNGKLAPGTYKWDVVTVSREGRLGSGLLSGHPTFTVEEAAPAVAAYPDVVSPVSGSFPRIPMLHWTPVEDATYYKIWIRINDGIGWDVLTDTFAYPAGTDASANHLGAGSYEWQVRAYTDSGEKSSSRTNGNFVISQPATVTGQANALTMTGYKAGQACTGYECTDLRQTPVLRWKPEPNTGFYKIWVTRDAALGNKIPAGELGVSANPFSVSGTLWSPTTALQESTAAEGYYWAVQPCTSADKCAANPVPVNSFNKASNPVDSLSPGITAIDGIPQGPVPVKSDDITLEWRDYLETNTTAITGSSQLATKSGQAAREYEVQVSTDHTFATLIDSATVDQRKFTSFNNTYPEGNIYWRVRAIDGSSNPLPFSVTRVFNKQSPVPVLNPMAGPQGPTPTLAWAPLNFAAAYELEVYAKGASVAKFTSISNQVQWSPTSTSQSLDPGTYEWRVRRKDAMNRSGGWSAKADFTVSNTAPTLVSPSSGSAVAPRDSLMRWDEVDGASDYRITLISPTGSTISQVTKATAWAPLTKLASGTWNWKVETRATNGVVSAESATQPFVVTDDVKATQEPRIEGSGQLDTVLTAYAPVWNHAPDEVTYQWYSGNTGVGDATLSYMVTTADLGRKITLRATAKTAGYPDTTSTSNAISAVQGAAPIAATPPVIVGTALVGETLSGGMPTWISPGVTTTQRWLINGSNAGAASTLLVRAGDLGKEITFEVTGKRTGYANAIVTSAPVTVQPGGALQATVQPTITGTNTVGTALSVTPGTWSQPAPTLKYQWLRTGAPIPSATGTSYRLTPEDAGRDIAVVVLATKSGFTDGSATSRSVSIAKMKSTVTGALKSARVKAKRKAKLSITLTVPGLATPNGTIQVLDKGKKIAQFTMAPSHKGVKMIKLRKLKKGKHKLKVVYLGNGQVFGSKSKNIILYVVKK